MIINLNKIFMKHAIDIHMNTTHGFGCKLSNFFILFSSGFDGVLWLALSNPVDWIVLVRVSFGFGWCNASVADTTKYATRNKKWDFSSNLKN